MTDPEQHAATVSPLAAVTPRDSSENLLITTASNLHMTSRIAEGKANMMLTVCALVMSVSASLLDGGSLIWAIIVVLATSAAAMGCAIRAVLPQRGASREVGRTAAFADPFEFFNLHHLTVDEHEAAAAEVLADDGRIYRNIINGLHAHSAYLAETKFLWLRRRYLIFAGGIAAGAVTAIVATIVG